MGQIKAKILKWELVGGYVGDDWVLEAEIKVIPSVGGRVAYYTLSKNKVGLEICSQFWTGNQGFTICGTSISLAEAIGQCQQHYDSIVRENGRISDE